MINFIIKRKMGKLFVIEGTDGAGKETQSNLLKERLKKENIDFKGVSFPNYDSISSSLVKMYLNGELGTNAEEISPYVASTFFAADRYITFKKEYSKYYEDGGIIIADRYTQSNMIHQAGKIQDDKECEKFLNWLWDFEFNLYNLPIPTEVIFLNMPIEYSQKLTENRKNKITNGDKKDIHESNIDYMKHAYNKALKLAKKYNWKEINCVKDKKIRSIEDIGEEVYNHIKKFI